MVNEPKTPKIETESDNNIESGDDQANRAEKVQDVIQEVLKNMEGDLNEIKRVEELTKQVKDKLKEQGIKIPDDIDDAINEAIGEFKAVIKNVKVWFKYLMEYKNKKDFTIGKRTTLETLEEEILKAEKIGIDLNTIEGLENLYEEFENLKEILEKEEENKKAAEFKQEPKPEQEAPENKGIDGELFEKSGELNLSNDDLKFFMDRLKEEGLENAEIFSFAKKELLKREKEGIDFDPIKQLPEKNKEENGISKEHIEEHFKYSDEELISHLKFGIEMAEKNIKKESIIATSWIELIEEEIKEAKNNNRNIDKSLVDKFKKNLDDIKEKAYLAEVMGRLNIAENYANEYAKNNDAKLKEAVGYWIISARSKENENMEKINKFDLEAIDKKVKEICAIVGFNENDITREEYQKSKKDKQRFLAISIEVLEKMKLRRNNQSAPKNDLKPEPEPETPEGDKTAEEKPEPEKKSETEAPEIEKTDQETETNPDDNQEALSVSEIVEKIKNGEEVGEGEGEILREKIKDIVFSGRKEKDWTDEEKKLMEVYVLGVKDGKFKEKNVNLLAVDFDLENVKYERSSYEEKKAKVEENKEKYKNDLIAKGTVKPEELIDNDKLNEVKELLKERVKEETEAYNKLIEEKYRAGENPFSEENKNNLKEVIEKIKKSNETELDLEKLEYYQLAADDAQLEFLINEHHTKIDYTIRMLENALEAYDKVLELLSIKEEDLTPEQKGILTKLFELMKKNPKTLIAILAVLAAAGLLYFYGPAILAALSGEAKNEITKEVIKKAAESGAGKAAAYGVGLAGAAGLGLLGGAIYALTDEKQRDKFVEDICGVSVPSWARSKKEK